MKFSQIFPNTEIVTDVEIYKESATKFIIVKTET